jgi:hypothetical protein
VGQQRGRRFGREVRAGVRCCALAVLGHVTCRRKAHFVHDNADHGVVHAPLLEVSSVSRIIGRQTWHQPGHEPRAHEAAAADMRLTGCPVSAKRGSTHPQLAASHHHLLSYQAHPHKHQ